MQNNHSKTELLKNEFDNNNILATILRFSIPSTIASIIGMFCVLTDRYFIGLVAGREGMSAIAVTFPYTMIINSLTFLFSGLSILIGVKLGEKNRKESEEILGSGFFIIIIFGAILSFLFWVFNDKILWYMGATKTNIVYAKQYTQFFIPIVIFQIMLGQSALIRSVGNPFAAMAVNIFTAVLNIILDYIFILKLSMGIPGASFATFISTFLSAIYVFYYFLKCDVITLKFKKMRFKFDILVEIFKIGSPRFANQLLQSTLITLTTKKIGIYGGDLAVAAIGVISIVRNVINTSFQGFNQGTSAVVSYNFGAKNYSKLKKILSIQVKFVVSISITLVILMLFNTEYIVSFFVKNDIELVKYTSKGMKLNLGVLFFTAIFLSCNNFLQAIKDSKTATFFFVFRILILNIPLIYILSFFFGATGVWLAFPIADAVAALSIFYITIKKINNLNTQ